MVFGRVWSALTYGQYQTDEEIIRDEFRDPGEYSRGWYDMPLIGVIHFAGLLAVHKAHGYERSDTDEGRLARGQSCSVFEKRVLSALRESAKIDAPFFASGQELL